MTVFERVIYFFPSKTTPQKKDKITSTGSETGGRRYASRTARAVGDPVLSRLPMPTKLLENFREGDVDKKASAARADGEVGDVQIGVGLPERGGGNTERVPHLLPPRGDDISELLREGGTTRCDG